VVFLFCFLFFPAASPWYASLSFFEVFHSFLPSPVLVPWLISARLHEEAAVMI
jgi:hypothetical protein